MKYSINILHILLIAFSLNAVSCSQGEEDDVDFADTEGPEVNMSGSEGEMVNFENWDTDRNQEINEIEFNPGFENNESFTNYDADKSSYLERLEFDEGVYSAMDVNKNKTIERTEYDRFASAWYGEAAGKFEDWDKNKDDVITTEEYNAKKEELNLFKNWDTNSDNKIDRKEYSFGMFKYYDKDGNGTISPEEFDEMQL